MQYFCFQIKEFTKNLYIRFFVLVIAFVKVSSTDHLVIKKNKNFSTIHCFSINYKTIDDLIIDLNLVIGQLTSVINDYYFTIQNNI